MVRTLILGGVVALVLFAGDRADSRKRIATREAQVQAERAAPVALLWLIPDRRIEKLVDESKPPQTN